MERDADGRAVDAETVKKARAVGWLAEAEYDLPMHSFDCHTRITTDDDDYYYYYCYYDYDYDYYYYYYYDDDDDDDYNYHSSSLASLARSFRDSSTRGIRHGRSQAQTSRFAESQGSPGQMFPVKGGAIRVLIGLPLRGNRYSTLQRNLCGFPLKGSFYEPRAEDS